MSVLVAATAALAVLLVARAVGMRLTTRRARTRVLPRSWSGRRHVWLRHRTRPPGTEQWAALLDTIAAEVRTGSSLTAAQQHATAHHPWFAVAADTHDADAALVRLTLHSARSLGGPVAATLDSAAAVLRERLAIRADIAVHSAQARLSARVLTSVPIAFCAWNTVTSASFRSALGSPVGTLCVALGVACNVVGWWWMRWCIQRVSR